MNCRPSDLARVVAPGRMVRCTCGATAVAIKPDTLVIVTRHDGIAWLLQEPIRVNVSLPCGVLIQANCTGLGDDILRPIRDPGDDAVDETLIYAGDPRVREVSHG
jgi:hypothetical protein